MTNLPAEVVQTADETNFTVIWMHGLGADGHDFVPMIPEFKLPESLAVKFIFPHAPVRPVTINNGMQMRAWYDMFSADKKNNADEDDILTTVGWITQLIDSEIESGTAANNIVLAGFSQGGVIALHAGMRYPQRLAGIMALSTYMPFDDNLIQQIHSQQQGTAIFSAHGDYDMVVPFTSWQDYVPKLKAKGFDVEAHSYAMEHSVCLEEITDISAWLQKVLQ